MAASGTAAGSGCISAGGDETLYTKGSNSSSDEGDNYTSEITKKRR